MSENVKSQSETWRVAGNDGGTQYDIQSDTEFIARVAHKPIPLGDKTAKQRARLIAAAPELLEACKVASESLSKWLSTENIPSDTWDEMHDLFEKLTATTQKAGAK